MGDAKVDTTLNVYTQAVDGSLRKAADVVGSELFTIERLRRSRAKVKGQTSKARRSPQLTERKGYFCPLPFAL
jgi:hypothetical protein